MSSEKGLSLKINLSKYPSLGSLCAASTDLGLAYFSYGLSQGEYLENIAQILGIQHLGHVHFSPKNSLAAVALEQVQEYLSGNRQQFTVPINWQLFTQFRTIVYQAVIAIPYGQTRAYSQIAAQIGRPKAARAVGGANASNPIPIIIPCHRLIGADGSLRGYGGVGGIQTKRWLLDLEKQHPGM